MNAIELSQQLVGLPEESLLGQQDIESQIRLLLVAEYLRRLSRHRRLDHTLSLKYGMSFDEFKGGWCESVGTVGKSNPMLWIGKQQ